jgi:hypothetical protein
VAVVRTLAELSLLAALLVAACLLAAGGSRTAPAAEPAPPRETDRIDSAGAGLTVRARALEAYLAAPGPRPPAERNPFGFREPVRSRGGGRPGARTAAETVAASAAARPEMVLSGIAEETGNGHPLRTAVISTPGELVFAKEGDRVLSRFLVLRIAADAVQLKDDAGGEVFVLTLK